MEELTLYWGTHNEDKSTLRRMLIIPEQNWTESIAVDALQMGVLSASLLPYDKEWALYQEAQMQGHGPLLPFFSISKSIWFF